MLVDPAKRREVKVSQYKKLKGIKERLQVPLRLTQRDSSLNLLFPFQALQKRRNQTLVPDSQTDFDLIVSLLPSTTSSSTPTEDLDSNTDELMRTTTILFLRMAYAQTHTQLESMEQELDLLRHAPPSPSGAPPSGDSDERAKDGSKGKNKQEQEQLWKLDVNTGVGRDRGSDGKGPLVDHRGRVSGLVT